MIPSLVSVVLNLFVLHKEKSTYILHRASSNTNYLFVCVSSIKQMELNQREYQNIGSWNKTITLTLQNLAEEQTVSRDLVDWLDRLTATAKDATVLGSIPASSDTLQFEVLQEVVKWLKIKIFLKIIHFVYQTTLNFV